SIFDKTRPKSAIFREADPLDPNAMKFGFLSYRMAGSYARTLQKILGDQINIIQNGDIFTFNLSESQITRLLALGKQALLPEASTLQQIQLLINELKIKQLLAFMDTDPNSTFKSLPSHDASSLKILLCHPEKIEEMLTLIEAIKGLVPDSSLIKIEDNGFDLSREQLLALKERLPLSETEKSKIDILIGGLSPEDAAAKESSHYLRSPYGGMMMPRREDERKAPDPRGEENEKQKAVGKQAPK
ncbi:MAG: hypothetical protein K0Q74_1614, partial [Gammaproteobacteria bacterium]|nr:hypothetical protein [Gammaproteobacteria bacterium]